MPWLKPNRTSNDIQAMNISKLYIHILKTAKKKKKTIRYMTSIINLKKQMVAKTKKHETCICCSRLIRTSEIGNDNERNLHKVLQSW